MEFLYVLQLANSKYYVGKTADVIKRFEQHKTGVGSAWTKFYPPVLLVEVRAITSPHDENNVTKDYMKKYGINNVRGGSYAQVTLPADARGVLEREFRGNDDRCMKCGVAGHFIAKCPMNEASPVEEWECEYCDRTFTTKYGCSVHERSCRPPSPPAKKCPWCSRCGRAGHYTSVCYATRHVKGYELDE
jgi:predicted GIY-YIG superfamily endonuclease